MIPLEIILNDTKPKYIQIFEQLTQMINTGILKSGQQLPSKRNLAISLNVSLNTIVNAYDLLLEEGYIYSLEKKGYFVANQPTVAVYSKSIPINIPKKEIIRYDFTTQNVEGFFNPQWNKLVKEVIDKKDYHSKSPLKGDEGLRMVISKHLLENRGIKVNYENIVIGTGMEMFEQILSCINIDSISLENPGYHKLAHIASNLNMNVSYLSLDKDGVLPPIDKTILYTTPFNQFPTGIKMSIPRKKELIQWAWNTNSYIIEDDFDAEFRINSAPTTALYSLSSSHVIFFSTFSTTLFPGLRISYAVLPDQILERYEKKYQYYSCPVGITTQIILKEFIHQGFYASHVNKMKRKYLKKREICIQFLKNQPDIELNYKRNYLSLLIKINTSKDDKELMNQFKEKGVKIQALSSFNTKYTSSHIFILGYTAISLEDIKDGLKLLIKEIKGYY